MKLQIPPSLKHKGFFYLWSGVLISVAGSRMQFTALLWHISTLTDEPIYLGLVGVARMVPILILSLVAGVVADSFNRRKILFITQSVQTLSAILLGWLTLSGQIELWHLYALTAIEAASFSFDLPARQSVTPNLVPKHELPNAFSMQSMAFTTASILGPVLAGLVLANPNLGQGYAYIFNAISFAAMFIALIGMGEVPQETVKGQKIDLSAISEGIAFISKAPMIISSMVLDFVATFFSSATALLPIFAADILQVGEVGYGWLTAAQFVGAAITAGILSQMADLKRQGPIMLGSVVVYGIATIGFGLAPSFWVAFVMLALVGASDTVSMVIRNTIRQLQTPDRLRGRMTSINQVFFIGGPQLGEMEAGTVAQFFGPIFAVVSGGIGCIIGVALIAWKWPQLVRYSNEQEEAVAVA